jgi:hypothetical protein
MLAILLVANGWMGRTLTVKECDGVYRIRADGRWPMSGLTCFITPEPSSVDLMLLGLGLVFVMRKRTGQGLSRTS